MAQHYEGEIITGRDGIDYEVVDAGGGFTGWDATAAAAGGAVGGMYAHGKMNGANTRNVVADEIAKFRKGETALEGAEAIAKRVDDIVANPKATAANIGGGGAKLGEWRLTRFGKQAGNRIARPFAHVSDFFTGNNSVQNLRDTFEYRNVMRGGVKPWEAAQKQFDYAVSKGKINGHSLTGVQGLQSQAAILQNVDTAIANVADDAVKAELQTIRGSLAGAMEHGRLFNHSALNEATGKLATIRGGSASNAVKDALSSAHQEISQVVKNTRPVDDIAAHASKLRAGHAGLEKAATRAAINAETDIAQAMTKASKTGGGKFKVLATTAAAVAGAGALAGLGHNMLMGGKDEKRQALGPHTERVMAQEARQQQAMMDGAGFSPA